MKSYGWGWEGLQARLQPLKLGLVWCEVSDTKIFVKNNDSNRNKMEETIWKYCSKYKGHKGMTSNKKGEHRHEAKRSKMGTEQSQKSVIR